MKMSGAEELLELRVGDGKAVDVERTDRQVMVVITAWRILPGILNVDSDIVAARNLQTLNLEVEFAARNQDHARWSMSGRFSRGNVDKVLRKGSPIIGVVSQLPACPKMHLGKKAAHRRRKLGRMRRQHSAEAVRFEIETQRRDLWPAKVEIRMELDSMPRVEVPSSGFNGDLDLPPRDVVGVAIDDRPQGLRLAGKLAREDAILQRGCMRLPAGADQQARKRPFDPHNPPQRFEFARRESVVKADHILLVRVSDSIEEGSLESVEVMASAARQYRHMPVLEPLVAADHGDEGKTPVTPGHVVPGQGLVCRQTFRLQGQRMSDLAGGDAKCSRHTVHRVAEQAVGADRGHQTRLRRPVRHAFVVCSLVPGRLREQHSNSMPVEVSDHLSDAGNPAWHVAQTVILIAVVDSQVRVGVPYQNAVNSPEFLL